MRARRFRHAVAGFIVMALATTSVWAGPDDDAHAPPKQGEVVDVDPAAIAPTQVDYGSAEVTLDLQKWAKGEDKPKHLIDELAKKFADPVPGFYGPPVAHGAAAKDVYYITDGHHHSAALYRLLYDYDALPSDITKVLSKSDLEALRSDPRFKVHVRVGRVFKTEDQVVVELTRHERSGLPDTLTDRPAFKAACKRVAQAGETDKADMPYLKRIFDRLPAGLKDLKDSPLRSVMGIFFKANDLSGGPMVDRVQFLLAKALQKKGFVIDTSYTDLEKTIEKVNKAVFDDPAIMKFLEHCSRKGEEAANLAQLKSAREAYLKGAAEHIDIKKLIKALCR